MVCFGFRVVPFLRRDLLGGQAQGTMITGISQIAGGFFACMIGKLLYSALKGRNPGVMIDNTRKPGAMRCHTEEILLSSAGIKHRACNPVSNILPYSKITPDPISSS